MKTYNTFFGLRTLIVGDVNTGKTSYTQLLLLECWGQGTTVVLDMAPERVRDIGGKMHVPIDPDIHYITARIRPPRLTAKNDLEAVRIASENAFLIDKDLLSRAEIIPADALIINDVSLYLQMGSPKRLIHVLEGFETVIMNGYFGSAFPDGELTQREKGNMVTLMEACNRVIKMEELNQLNK